MDADLRDAADSLLSEGFRDREALSRIAGDPRLSTVWPEIRKAFAPRQGDRELMEWERPYAWREFLRRLLGYLATRGGRLPKKTPGALKRERNEIAGAIQTLVYRIERTQDPVFRNIGALDLLECCARSGATEGAREKAARSLEYLRETDTAALLVMSSPSIVDLLKALESTLIAGDPLTNGERGKPFPGIPERPGTTDEQRRKGQRRLLENRLLLLFESNAPSIDPSIIERLLLAAFDRPQEKILPNTDLAQRIRVSRKNTDTG